MRLTALKVLEVLKSESDKNHPLTLQKIADKLAEKFDSTGNSTRGNRHTVRAYIEALQESDYPIVRTSRGYYLEPDFEDSELRMLIDSVLFSNLPHDTAKNFIEKLKKLGNKRFKPKVRHVYNLSSLKHSDNEQIMNSIDVISDAISTHKKISFVYSNYGTDFKLHPRRDKPYKISPFQMVTANSRYYLIANTDGHDNISHYRIDRMTDVKMLDEPARELLNQNNPITDFVGNLNLPKHMAEHVYMFSGKSIRVKFWTYEFMMNCLVDWFGKDFHILKNQDDRILIEVTVNEHAIKYWIMQFGEFVEVVMPVTLREEICKTAEKIMNAHS